MCKKEKAAKFVRVITVPPVLVLLLLAVLIFGRNEIFQKGADIGLSILLLGIVPVMAYPLQKLLPQYRDKGREGQRSLAFLLNTAGYGIAAAYGIFSHVNQELLLVYLTYFLSVLILVFCNKIVGLRASGHACSVTGPLVFFIYFIGWKSILPCVLTAGLIVWSSLLLKRHTGRELLAGAAICLAAFLCSSCILWIF